jgi:cyanate permease
VAGSERATFEMTTPKRALVILAIGVGLIIGSATTVPGFFVESAGEKGLGANLAGLVLAGGAACGIAARLFLGTLTDRAAVARLRTVALMASTGATGFLLISMQVAVLQALGVVVVFVLGWGWVGLFQYIVSIANRGNPGAATGIADTGGYLGACVGPAAIGIIAERHSFRPAWMVAFAAATIGSALIVQGARHIDPHSPRHRLSRWNRHH